MNVLVIPALTASSSQDYQFYIQNFTALQLGTVVPPGRQATFEYSFIPAEPMGGRPFGLVINLNYKDSSVRRTGPICASFLPFITNSCLLFLILRETSSKMLCSTRLSPSLRGRTGWMEKRKSPSSGSQLPPLPLLTCPLPSRIFMYVFLSGLGLLVIVGLHQLLESRKVWTCFFFNFSNIQTVVKLG